MPTAPSSNSREDLRSRHPDRATLGCAHLASVNGVASHRAASEHQFGRPARSRRALADSCGAGGTAAEMVVTGPDAGRWRSRRHCGGKLAFATRGEERRARFRMPNPVPASEALLLAGTPRHADPGSSAAGRHPGGQAPPPRRAARSAIRRATAPHARVEVVHFAGDLAGKRRHQSLMRAIPERPSIRDSRRHPFPPRWGSRLLR